MGHAGDTLRGPDMAVGIVAGYEDSLFGYRILVNMDIGHMFRTTYGIRQTGRITKIEKDMLPLRMKTAP
jgi:hypothetical protein